MQRKRYQLREGKLPFATIFTVGVFAGIFCMNLGKSMLLENTGLLDEYSLSHMKYATVDGTALFYYVLKQRLGCILILAILATTYLGFVICCVVSLWYGVCVGAFLGAAVLRYGIKGMLLVFGGIFPQYLVYVPAMIAMLLWCRNIYRMIYLDRTLGWEGTRPFFFPKSIIQLVLIAAVFLVGCILESFLNPMILKGILNLF